MGPYREFSCNLLLSRHLFMYLFILTGVIVIVTIWENTP